MEQRIGDDIQGDLHHFPVDLINLAALPLSHNTLSLFHHLTGVSLDAFAVQSGLHQPPLATVQIASAEMISTFVNRHPTIKMLALSFLLLIGFTLVVEGLHQEIPKGYTYFAMGFSVFVEMLNLRMREGKKPVRLHEAYVESNGIDPEKV